MKKWLIGVMTVLMAVSLAACTPTTEKQKMCIRDRPKEERTWLRE